MIGLDDKVLHEIEDLIRKDDLTNEEIVFILSNKIEQENKLLNIDLFNKWIRKKYDYQANSHKIITLKYIELRHVDLSQIDLRFANIINCEFVDCNFSSASMLNCNIQDAHFWNCNLSESILRGSKIEDCKFDSIFLEGLWNLLETKIFNSSISLDNNNYDNLVSIDFSNSILENLTITIPTSSSGGQGVTFINPTGMDNNSKISESILHELIFKYCTIKGLRLVNLNIERFIADYAVIKDSDIINSMVTYSISMTKIMLNNLRVKKEFFDVFYNNILKTMKCRTPKTISKELTEILATIKDNFNTINDSQSKRIYYVLIKEYERFEYKIEMKSQKFLYRFYKFIKYLLLTFYKIFTGYGQSPIRLFYIVLSIATLSGVVGYLFKLTDAPTIGSNLYFSLITFLTIGYGDYKPINIWGKLLFGMEGFFGVVLMNLFIVVLTKWIFDE
jgi:Uncharacterized low-complexity proteins